MSLTNSNGTVDITNAVNTMQADFVAWAVKTIEAYIFSVPTLAFLAAPFLSYFLNSFLTWLVNILAGDAVMNAFFLNTAIKKASQAQDYVNASNAVINLPPNATEAQIETAENNRIKAFTDFVVLTD